MHNDDIIYIVIFIVLSFAVLMKAVRYVFNC